MADPDALEADLRRREKRAVEVARKGELAQSKAVDEEAAAEREMARAEGSAGHEVAQAIRESLRGLKDRGLPEEGRRPKSAWIVVIFLLGFVLAGLGLPPLWVMLAVLVALFIELVRQGSDELVHVSNLFFIIFLVFHLFVDAVNSFSWGPTRFSALFAFGIVYWGLFRRKDVVFEWSNAQWILRSLATSIGAWVVYGWLPALLALLTRVGLGQEVLNVVLVVGPVVAVLFAIPETLLLQGMKKALLVLCLVSLLMYAFNAGLAGSLTNLPGLKGTSVIVERWGALTSFGLLFWSPIKTASLNFYVQVWGPACREGLYWFETSVLGEYVGFSKSACPAVKEEGQKRVVKDGEKEPVGGISGWIERRIDFATGQVEETKKEPPGVTLEPLTPQSSAVEGQPVVATGKIKAVALDKPVEIALACRAYGESVNASADSITPSDKVRIEKKDQRGVICVFDSLPVQSYTFGLTASFGFKTVGYLKWFAALDKELSDLGSREAWIARYGIDDPNPDPKFTPGPVSLGIRLEEQNPVVLYPKASPQRIFLNIPIENAYRGRIRQIKRLLVAVPKGLELEGVFGGRQRGEIVSISCGELPAEDARGCNDDQFSLYDVVVKDRDVSGITYRAVLRVSDYAALIEFGPPATNFVKVIVDYEYVLEERSSALAVEAVASKSVTGEEIE